MNRHALALLERAQAERLNSRWHWLAAALRGDVPRRRFVVYTFRRWRCRLLGHRWLPSEPCGPFLLAQCRRCEVSQLTPPADGQP